MNKEVGNKSASFISWEMSNVSIYYDNCPWMYLSVEKITFNQRHVDVSKVI